MSARIQGLVKWFNEDKGFGFISPLDGSKDVLVRLPALHSDNLDTLFEGQKVEFAIHTSEKGPAATHVILCDR